MTSICSHFIVQVTIMVAKLIIHQMEDNCSPTGVQAIAKVGKIICDNV
jgi:hypothetical protein